MTGRPTGEPTQGVRMIRVAMMPIDPAVANPAPRINRVPMRPCMFHRPLGGQGMRLPAVAIRRLRTYWLMRSPGRTGVRPVWAAPLMQTGVSWGDPGYLDLSIL